MKNRDALVEALGSDAKSYDIINMVTAGYSAPYTILDRKNEVWIPKI
jgi:hypothetical protein